MSTGETTASVFVATSLDGYIAREDGGIDWLPSGEPGDPGEDYGFSAFYATVDAVVMGRNTWELVRSFDSWQYGEKAVIVLTSRAIDIPPERRSTVTAMSGTPAEIVARLAERGLRHLYVDGGRTTQAFLAAGLVRRLVLTRIPVLLGRGIPLFGALPGDVRLRHVRTRSWPSGLVQGEYEIP